MPNWGTVRVYSAMLGILLVAHWLAIESLLEFWSTSLVYDYGGWLTAFVFLIAGLELRKYSLAGFPASLSVILSGAAVSTLLMTASIAALMLGQMILLPTIVLLTIAALVGYKATAGLVWLFVALVFSWPVWDFLIGPLQQLTIWVTSALLTLADRSALIQGDTVFLRSGSFVVERGCAGLNFFLVGTTLGVLAGHWLTTSLRARLVVLAAAVLFSVVANWFRVFGIVLIGDLTDMQHGVVEEHAWFGWTIFAGSMLGFVLLANTLCKEPLQAEPRSGDVSTWSRQNEALPLNGRPHWYRLAAAAMIAMPPAILGAVVVSQASPPATLAHLPQVVGSWQLSTGTQVRDSTGPVFPLASSMNSGVYSAGADRIEVWIAAYPLGLDKPELVGFPNAWYRKRDWRVVHATTETAVATGSVAGPELLQLAKGEERRVVMAGYVFGGRLTHSRLEAKLHRTLSLLKGDNQAFALVASIDCKEDCQALDDSLAGFVRDVHASGFESFWRGKDVR